MPTTAFEVACNDLRGWACLFVTLGSVVVVLSEPASLIFWVPGAYMVISAPSGTAGFLIAAFFLLYLVVDTAVGVMCRHQFRRSMGAWSVLPVRPHSSAAVTKPQVSGRCELGWFARF